MPNPAPTPPAEILSQDFSEDKTITLTLREADGGVYVLIYPAITEERWVEIGAGIRAPEHIDLHATIEAGKVTMRVLPRAGGFHVRAVTLESPDDDVAVTSDALRTVPVGRLLHACRYTLHVAEVPSLVNTTWTLAELGGWVPDRKRREWPGGRIDVVLDTVTVLYRVAAAVGDAPTQSVAASFGVSRATASRMIAKAREAKLLEEADRQWTGGNTRPRK